MKVVNFFGIKNQTNGKRGKTKPVKLAKPVNFLGIKPVKQKGQKSLSKKNMNWFQAKRKYPKLSPFGDIDKDGVINYLDCKPFNKKKQDVPHNPSPVQIHSSSVTVTGGLNRPAMPGESYTGKPSNPLGPIMHTSSNSQTPQIVPVSVPSVNVKGSLGRPALGNENYEKTAYTRPDAQQQQAQQNAINSIKFAYTSNRLTPSEQIKYADIIQSMSPQKVKVVDNVTNVQAQNQTKSPVTQNPFELSSQNPFKVFTTPTTTVTSKTIPQQQLSLPALQYSIVPSNQKLYGGLTADQRYAATVQSLQQKDLGKFTPQGLLTTASFYTKPAFTTADPFKINTALTYAGQAIQAIPGSKLTGFSPQEAAQKRQDIMQRAYTEYSYDPKTGKEIGKIEPGMSVGQKITTVLEPTYKTSVGQNLLVTAAALPIGFAVGTVLKSAPVVLSVLPEKVVEGGTQFLSSPTGQTAVKTLGAGALAYGGYKAVAEPTIKAIKEGLPTGEVFGTAVTKGLGFGGALAMGVEGAKLGIKYGIPTLDKGAELTVGEKVAIKSTRQGYENTVNDFQKNPTTENYLKMHDAEQKMIEAQSKSEGLFSDKGAELTVGEKVAIKSTRQGYENTVNDFQKNPTTENYLKMHDAVQKMIEAQSRSEGLFSDKGGSLGGGSIGRVEELASKIRTPEERIEIFENSIKNILTPEQKVEVAKQVAQDLAKIK